MKKKIWLLQLPVIFLTVFLYMVVRLGTDGYLESSFLRENVFNPLRSFQGLVTNIKFVTRGPEKPKNKIVIVEVDSKSLSERGRWPWHRDQTAHLIEQIFQAGAKVVGMDIVFSEPDQRVSPEMRSVLGAFKLEHLAEDLETDRLLSQTIFNHREKLVLGWASENHCTPALNTSEICPVGLEDQVQPNPEGYERFAYQQKGPQIRPYLDEPRLPFVTMMDMIPNYSEFTTPAEHAGYFQAFPDPDGYIRKASILMSARGKIFPPLAMKMAALGLGESPEIELAEDFGVKRVLLTQSAREIPVSRQGAMEINFRGPGYTFTFVSATDLMGSEETHPFIQVSDGAKSVDLPRAEAYQLLKDAYVIVGVTALGVFDLRPMPFDHMAVGVEGHAHILDNLLSGDMFDIKQSNSLWLLFILSIGAMAFAFTIQRLESVPGLLLFLGAIGAMLFIDMKILFANRINWNTSLVYSEFALIFTSTIAIKYILEERNKKFIRGAFSKYVAPAIVDSILKDPTKLTVGGVKKDVTILFSDIRSFTSFSEQMDAKALANFLNDYLGIMTEIVFENEGTLDKYIGDAVMAFWGAPLDQPMHALNACKGAVKMQLALDEHRQRFKTQYTVPVNIGIGINTGAVTVGNLGSERIFEYTVIGDHVNLASRLEGLTKAYGAGILTTRFTFDSIQETGGEVPAHRVLDFVKVKGKKNAVELIQIFHKPVKAEGLAAFEAARVLYASQRWDEAITQFEKAAPLIGDPVGDTTSDPTCEIFIDRCKEFKKEPPSADWDGSWEMHSK